MRALSVLLLLASCAPPSPPASLVPPTATGASGAAGPPTSTALRALESDLRVISRIHAGDTAEIAIALLDLATRDSLLLAAHLPMHAASTMKVPVMLELHRRAAAGDLSLDAHLSVDNRFRSIADGSWYSLAREDDSDPALHAQIGEAVPIRLLVERMITRSSNLAVNLLIDRAGTDRIARTLAELGASGMRVLRGVEDGAAFARGLNNTTTAYALMKVMEEIAGGSMVPAEARAEMLRALEDQRFREMIPAGVPAQVRVGNKTGWVTGIVHDAAIVIPPGRKPYVLVVLTRGFRETAAAERAVRHVSRRVYYELVARGSGLVGRQHRLDPLSFTNPGAPAVHGATGLERTGGRADVDPQLRGAGQRGVPGSGPAVGGDAAGERGAHERWE